MEKKAFWMKKDEIPKPVTQKVSSEDLRKTHLNEWKRLFESLDEGIEVTLYTDEGFRKLLEREFDRFQFSGTFWDQARILIILPNEYHYDYLVGRAYDRMFSNIDVWNDPLTAEDISYDCEPNTKKWKEFYEIVFKESESKKKEIPRP